MKKRELPRFKTCEEYVASRVKYEREGRLEEWNLYVQGAPIDELLNR
jgi:5'-3' exonuclease